MQTQSVTDTMSNSQSKCIRDVKVPGVFIVTSSCRNKAQRPLCFLCSSTFRDEAALRTQWFSVVGVFMAKVQFQLCYRPPNRVSVIEANRLSISISLCKIAIINSFRVQTALESTTRMLWEKLACFTPSDALMCTTTSGWWIIYRIRCRQKEQPDT